MAVGSIVGPQGTIVGPTESSGGGTVTTDLTVGTTVINGGTAGYVLFDNNGVLGEQVVGGTGTVTSITVGSALTSTQNPITTIATLNLNTANANIWSVAQTFISSGIRLRGQSTGYTSLAVTNATANNYTVTFPGMTSTVALLDSVNSFTAANTFANSNLRLLGSSTGYTTFTSDNTGATNYTLHVPAANDTLALLGATQTFTGVNTFVSGGVRLLGTSTGYTTLATANTSATNYTVTLPAASGTVPLTGATNTFTAINTFNSTTNFTGNSPQIVAGATGGTLGGIQLNGSTSGHVIIQAAAVAGPATLFQLPSTNGTSGYVLTTDGTGVLSWSAGLLSVGAPIGGGTVGDVLVVAAGSLLGQLAPTGTGVPVFATSPALAGVPTTVTPPARDNTTQIPNTTWVQGEITYQYNTFILPVYAPLNSPALTGYPTAPTQGPGAGNDWIATCAYADDTAVENATYYAGLFDEYNAYAMARDVSGDVKYHGDLQYGSSLVVCDAAGNNYSDFLPGAWQCYGWSGFSNSSVTIWRRYA